MHYDVAIIGAGMSGLAAGIRLAHFEKNVCIFERHYAYGGLNSYYRLAGRDFDVGLHAVTNCGSADDRAAPLNKLLRQLRFTREDFDLCPQRHSEIRFPRHRLRFSNGPELLMSEVAAVFPGERDRFANLLQEMRDYDITRLEVPWQSTREALGGFLRDPVLIEMLLCPTMFYGNAEEHDMEFHQFATLFRSLFCEGFARPRDGVRHIVKALVKKYRACGGTLRMRSGVRHLVARGNRVTEIELDDGEHVTADVVLSSAGSVETLRLFEMDRARVSPHEAPPDAPDVGRVSFVETIAVLDELPHRLGHEATIVFYSDSDRFHYARPDAPIDTSSGVICCPTNYANHEDSPEGYFRVTWLADPGAWLSADDATYTRLKDEVQARFRERAERTIPGCSSRIVFLDTFTPRTIFRFTGHLNGAVYGSPRKHRDGRTPFSNLFLCGTDQGYLGIIGAMLSGITVANLHVLSKA